LPQRREGNGLVKRNRKGTKPMRELNEIELDQVGGGIQSYHVHFFLQADGVYGPGTFVKTGAGVDFISDYPRE
jgi:hypothetical protein